MVISAPTLPLRNGVHIPLIGLGTSPLRGAESTAQVRTAIEAGYRLIDTAENYHNEEAVGQGIRDSGVDRSELFITTKFNRAWHSVDGVRQAYEASLQRLGVDYLDLLLVHWPNPDQDRYVDAWKALQALRPYAKRKLVVIFGAGGDRDAGKRPIMGAIAAENADQIIVTDDNPRSENPATIRAAILAAAKGASDIGDRAEAIRAGIAALQPGDALLIAGKGHETGQIVGDKVLPFSDHEAVAAALAARVA